MVQTLSFCPTMLTTPLSRRSLRVIWCTSRLCPANMHHDEAVPVKCSRHRRDREFPPFPCFLSPQSLQPYDFLVVSTLQVQQRAGAYSSCVQIPGQHRLTSFPISLLPPRLADSIAVFTPARYSQHCLISKYAPARACAHHTPAASASSTHGRRRQSAQDGRH